MLNAAQRVMAAQGMGGLNGLGAIDWDSLFDRGFDFGNTFLQQWGNRGAYEHGVNPNVGTGVTTTQGLTAAQIQTMIAAQNAANNAAGGGGVGLGIDSSGIRLSDGSHIGWFPIIAVLGGVVLLQSSGFQRRR